MHACLGIQKAPVGKELDYFLGLRIENDEATIYNNTYVSRGVVVYMHSTRCIAELGTILSVVPIWRRFSGISYMRARPPSTTFSFNVLI